ncbi:PspA/IM30 family protein [Ottowia sp.]|uniref:PspA/IM30 family protein n=1 Tax=Ottowia sp. TaxID=1898956 RepID=UPI0025F9B933|nr:PspA/IM30 family protein [Ottowia sp.]MBK6616523.1 PspA/IM30 family protein [Ottowia sp.]
MADNSIMSRMWNLWTGFVSLWVRDIEKEHPEIAYQNSIQSMQVKYKRLKTAAGKIIARKLDIEERLKTARTELAGIQKQLDAALATTQDDLALVCIQKKESLSADIATMEGEFEGATTDAEEVKTSLLEMKGEIDRLKAEQDRMVAMLQSAEARLQVQESLDGLSIDAEVQALSSVREHIKGRVAEAKLGSELRESDLDVRLKKLTQVSGSVSARAELARLKQAQAAGAGSATKTL